MITRPVVYAFLAMWLYAFSNVVIEVKLAKYTTMALLLYWYFILAPLAVAGLGYMYLSGQKIVVPHSSDAWMAIAAAVVFFFADYFYIGAYTSGGSLLAVTTLVVLFPAVAQLIKFAWVGGSPNYYHLAGYLLAAIAMVLISKGSAVPK